MIHYLRTHFVFLLSFVCLRAIAGPITQDVGGLDIGESISDLANNDLIDVNSLNVFDTSAAGCPSDSAESVFEENPQNKDGPILPRQSQGTCSTNRHGPKGTEPDNPTTKIPGSEPDSQTSEPADQMATDDPKNQCSHKKFSHLVSCVGPEIRYFGDPSEVSQFFAAQKFRYDGVVNCRRGKLPERY